MKKEENVYISNLPLEEALKAFENQLDNPERTETVRVSEASGRRTCRAIFAKRSSPSEHCAAMDGIAVKAIETHGANERNPIQLKEKDQFVFVNTGNLMPPGMDSVIMIEDVKSVEDGVVEIIEAAYPWQHIRQVGEDIIRGDMILPSNHVIRPMDLGALIQGGIDFVEVYCPFKVGILPTGNEIVQSLEALESGKIIDSNSAVLAALVTEMGGIPTVYSVCPDDPDSLKNGLSKGVKENDLMMTVAGSSAGKKDFTANTIASLGEVIVHGVAIKPGKPTILGKIEGKGVIGLPGYPVSCYLAFQSFVAPILEMWSNAKFKSHYVTATTTQKMISSVKHEELVRVTLGEVLGKWVATPLNREAGATMSLVRADGLMIIPRLVEGIEVGKSVNVKLLKPIEQIQSRLVVIGSHDPLIDILSDQMPLASTHVGSFGGVLALRRKECHLAPIHLLDEKTGEYNLSTARQYFKSDDMVLIRGVRRLQGLFVPKGNPKNIHGIEDFTRSDVEFVNRQRGAGTRQLLDFELKKRQIDVKDISGYAREMTTHTAVAVAVSSGSADVGVGVLSAAKALGIDFIPIGYESYDFLTYKEMLSDPRVMTFIEVLKSERFKETVESIGGYELIDCGEIIAVEH